MFASKSKIIKLKMEKKKFRTLLQKTWDMIDSCRLDFHSGITHNGVDEGYEKGWQLYGQLQQEVFKALNDQMSEDGIE